MTLESMTRVGPWHVRLVWKGARYGRADALTHRENEPLVEFYDARADEAKFGPRGQFVARYNATTIICFPADRGLALDFGVPAWTVTPEEMAQVCAWVQTQAVDELSS